eukprot:5875191-Prorocentrum_lima.AAC.1
MRPLVKRWASTRSTSSAATTPTATSSGATTPGTMLAPDHYQQGAAAAQQLPGIRSSMPGHCKRNDDQEQ